MASKDGKTKPVRSAAEVLVTVVAALEDLGDDDKRWVLQSAASRWNATLHPAGSGSGTGTIPGSVTGAAVAAQAGDPAIAAKNIKAFMRAKNPANDVQRVACLGFYIAETTSQAGFTAKQVADAHTNSGGSKFNLSRAMDNATRSAKYLSNRTKHEKQLTTLGEDVVNALPNQQAVRDLSAKARGKAKKGKRGS